MSEAAARVLSVLHVTRYAYSAEVEAAQHAAVLVRRDTPWQRVLEWSWTSRLSPMAGAVRLSACGAMPGAMRAWCLATRACTTG